MRCLVHYAVEELPVVLGQDIGSDDDHWVREEVRDAYSQELEVEYLVLVLQPRERVVVKVVEYQQQDELQGDQEMTDPAMEVMVLVIGVLVDVAERAEEDVDEQNEQPERGVHFYTVVQIELLESCEPSICQHEHKKGHDAFRDHVENGSEDIEHQYTLSIFAVNYGMHQVAEHAGAVETKGDQAVDMRSV